MSTFLLSVEDEGGYELIVRNLTSIGATTGEGIIFCGNWLARVTLEHWTVSESALLSLDSTFLYDLTFELS